MYFEQSYPEWQAKLDSLLFHEIGCPSSCLTTFRGRELYDSGATPEQAADIALAYGLSDMLIP